MPTLTIATAASVNAALTDMIPAIKTACSVTDVNIIPASSGLLADQIAVGTIKPDIFFSAAIEPMNQLVGVNMVVGTSKNLLRNNLVLIKNRANGPHNIISFQQVNATNAAGVDIFIGQPEFTFKVPAGRYARAAFQYFGNWTWLSTTPPTTFEETVTAVLNAVAGSTTNPAIGAVYFTDAAAFWVTNPSGTNPVEIIAIAPSAVNDTIIYPVAQIGSGANQTAASAFMTFVQDQQNPVAMNYFLKWGFIPY